MKTSVKFLILVFAFSALILSTLSVRKAMSTKVWQCTLDVPYTYKLPYFVSHCICHGEEIDLVECRWATPSSQCYPTFCEE